MKNKRLIQAALVLLFSVSPCLADDDDSAVDQVPPGSSAQKAAPSRPAMASPLLPPVRQLLSIGSLTTSQKSQIDAIYKGLNGNAHASAEQIHARIMAAAKSRANAQSLSSQAQNPSAKPAVAMQARKQYAIEYGAATGYHEQARRMQSELAKQRQSAWIRVRSILTADQLKAFDQSTRNMYVPQSPAAARVTTPTPPKH